MKGNITKPELDDKLNPSHQNSITYRKWIEHCLNLHTPNFEMLTDEELNFCYQYAILLRNKSDVLGSCASLCMHCHSIVPVNSMECINCGSSEFYQVDRPIADHISMLNKKGYHTNYSCCGHGNLPRAYITFSDPGLDLNIFKNLPPGWGIEATSPLTKSKITLSNNNAFINVVIRGNDRIPVSKDFLKELRDWIITLPDISKEKE